MAQGEGAPDVVAGGGCGVEGLVHRERGLREGLSGEEGEGGPEQVRREGSDARGLGLGLGLRHG